MLNYESVSVYIAPGDQWPLHCMVLPLVLVPAQLSSSVQIAPLQTAVRCLWAVICHPHDRNIDCVEILVLSLQLNHEPWYIYEGADRYLFPGVGLGLFQWGETWMMVLWVTLKVLRCDGRNNQFINFSVHMYKLSNEKIFPELDVEMKVMVSDFFRVINIMLFWNWMFAVARVGVWEQGEERIIKSWC